ncbi:MAG: FkbM family methyltransferase [Oscillatoriales cyanobacterium SM2_2_1]|nr:FkbM family methyltransferase [Oscillatoriales cyanobacterium SM2_2_1]
MAHPTGWPRAIAPEMPMTLQQAYAALLGVWDGDRRAQESFLEFLEMPHPPREQAGAILDLPDPELTVALLAEDSAQNQVALLWLEVWRRSLMFPHLPDGLRVLRLESQVARWAAPYYRRLGIYSLHNREPEGLFYLKRAQAIAPCPRHELALEFGYVTLGLREPNPAPYYVPFDLPLAVEPDYASVVTSVLLAEGDWFEAELDLWRWFLQPGMTAIDVGANVGIYTISAAQRVGSRGRVLAIEPFSHSAALLIATCARHGLDWVTVYRAAAGDRPDQVKLGLFTASETNAILAEVGDQAYEEVSCLPLDQIIATMGIEEVSALKIDAEGQELAVLVGARQLLERCQPLIVYEYQSGKHGQNDSAGALLQELGYGLYAYNRHRRSLEAIATTPPTGILNVVAIHTAQYENVAFRFSTA